MREVSLSAPGTSRTAHRARHAVLFSLFVFSGVGGLSFEVVWTRQLATSIGSTSSATTTVVALFMAGLALGNALGARLARGARPLRRYALAEAGIALGAAACTAALPHVEALASTPARYAAAALLLLAPTTFMGATWPLLAEAWRRDDPRAAGTLYGANTLGAALGALLTGFVLVGVFGLRRTGYLAAGLDLACALAALALAARESGPARSPEPEAPAPEAPAPRDARVPPWFYALAAGAGFVALAEELLWTRALLPYANSSTYAFASILGLYLLGIAAGGLAAARARTSTSTNEGAAGPVLARLQLALALAVGATPLLFARAERLLPAYVGVRRATTLAAWLDTVLGVFAKSAIALAAPTVLLGAVTAVALRVAAERGLSPSRAAGAYGAANTVGSIAGSALAGFVLLPALGAHRAIELCAVLHLALAAAWYLLATPRERPRAWALGAGAVAALVALLAWFTPAAPFTGRLSGRGTVLLVDEGPQDTTAVVEYASDGARYRTILSNGVSYAGDAPKSQRYMRLLGHLPALFAEDPSRALVICVGTGTTAGSLARHASVRDLTLVDISPVVHRTLPLFSHVNHAVWRDPRVHIVEADGRQYLSRSAGSFGVITLEPPPPRIAGAASLYNREFYARARAALRPGGVLAQWLPLHGMTSGETRMLVRTFVDVFPDAALFVLTDEEAALVGGPAFAPDLDRARARLAEPGVGDSLRAVGFVGATPEALLREVLMMSPAQGARLRALAGDGPLVRDDAPLIEQFAVGLARDRRSEAGVDEGRAELFAALARTPATPLPARGALPEGLAAELTRAWSRDRSSWPPEVPGL